MKHRVNKSEYMQGFSIIELSVVLTVISLVIGLTVTLGVSRIDAARTTATQDRMNFIMEALELHVKAFGYLPCPADNSLTINDMGYGDGVGSGVAGNATCTAANESAGMPLRVVIGGVPIRQLNLTDALMKDGWGRRFSYVVTEPLTKATGMVYTYGMGNGTITVRGSTDVMFPNITMQAAVVLISHGANGHGAWRGKGTTRLNKGAASAEESENSYEADGTLEPPMYETFNSIFIQQFPSSNFDDIVMYKMKWQFEEPD